MKRAGYHMRCTIGLLLLVGGSLLSAQAVWAGSPPDKELDCEVYETEKYSVTVGFSVGNLLLSAGPEVTASYERGIAWDKVVQGLIARYVEVCTRYNAGMVTKEQYAARVQEIETLYREAQEYERQMLEDTRGRANDAFAELDAAFGGPSRDRRPSTRSEGKRDPIASGLQGLGARIEDLAP